MESLPTDLSFDECIARRDAALAMARRVDACAREFASLMQSAKSPARHYHFTALAIEGDPK